MVLAIHSDVGHENENSIVAVSMQLVLAKSKSKMMSMHPMLVNTDEFFFMTLLF